MASIDVIIVPSIWYENTPLVIYSAQCAKRPVIASNLGGMSEIVRDGMNGLLFDAGNSKKLAELILKVYEDRELLNSLSRNINLPKSYHDYSLELLSIYDELIDVPQ